MALTRANDYSWMYVCVLICWLWLSGRLPAEQTHLVNETFRSRGEKDGEERGKEEVGKRRRQREEKWEREKDMWRQWEPPWCHGVWWNVELMRSWRFTPSTAASTHSFHPPTRALPIPTWQRFDRQSGCSAAAPVEQVRNPIFTQGFLSGSIDPILSSSVSRRI